MYSQWAFYKLTCTSSVNCEILVFHFVLVSTSPIDDSVQVTIYMIHKLKFSDRFVVVSG